MEFQTIFKFILTMFRLLCIREPYIGLLGEDMENLSKFRGNYELNIK